MTWHYLDGNEQRGPVTDADVEALFRDGKINANTLVWHEGMAEWQPYSQAKSPGSGSPPRVAVPATMPAGYVACAECGRAFPPDEVIRHGNVAICANCKPVFLQKLKEGVTTAGTLNYAGFWIRFLAKFVDGLVIYAVLIPLSLGVRAATGGPVNLFQPNMTAAFISGPINLILMVAYYTFFVGKYGATLGKMATKLRIVNPDGSPVGYGKACGRLFAEIVSALICYIGYLMVAWDPEKRALHDRICNTRVIRK